MKQRAKIGSRPESAKTQDTKLTLQSQANISSFSETDTFLTRRRLDEKDDFGKYVDYMDRKTKNNLPTIAQKKENEQFKNQTCKPSFERRSSNVKPAASKIEPQVTKQDKPAVLSKTVKLEQPADNKSTVSQKSNKFIDKSIRKMNELLVSNKQPQKTNQQSVRINFAAFIANDPLKRQKESEKRDQEKRQKRVSEEKVKEEVKKPSNRSRSQDQRMDEIAKATEDRKIQTDQLSIYVNNRELRNMDSFPAGYERAIEQASQRMQTDHNLEELQNLDVSQFKDFGDCDIFKAMDNIKKLDQRIERAESGQTIDDTVSQKDEDELEYSQDTEQKSMTQSSISMLKKNNNLFLTEILKGNLSRQDLQVLVDMQKSHNKLIQLQQQDQLSDSDGEVEIKRDARFIEKNKIQSAGGLFLECDYLAEEHRKRLDELMLQIESGQQNTPNPFALPQSQAEHLRRLDQGISVYQNMFQEGRSDEPVIYEQNLPKDPVLRRQSEMKILRDKITSVNTSLRNLQNIPVDRFKIQSLVAKLKQMTVTRPPSAMIQSTRREFDEIKKRVEESEQFLQCSASNRETIISELNDIKSRFHALEEELRVIDQMTEVDIEKLQRQDIQDQRVRLERYEQMYTGAEASLGRLEEYTQQLRQRIQQIDQVGEIEIPVLEPEGFSLEETMEQLDARISKKAEEAPRS